MSNGTRTLIERLPERLTQLQAFVFFEQLQPVLEKNRAYLVFDFSRLREIDSAGVGVLLRCLEEVLKGNGDLKFAAVPPEVGVILELTGVDRLFEIFETTSEAVESFNAFAVPEVVRTFQVQESTTGAEEVSEPDLPMSA